MECETCGMGISEKVAKFSRDKYGEYLCFDHQKTHHHLSELSKATNGAVVTPPLSKNYSEELVADEEYSGAFYGMCFNQAVENARAFEKTYEDIKHNLPHYYNDMVQLATQLTKRR